MTASKTNSAPPVRRPTAADVELLSAAQSTELAARDLYNSAIAAGAGGEHLASLVALSAHHDAYAQSISSLIGADAPQTRDDELFNSLVADFGSDTVGVALAAHGLENSIVAAHTTLVGELVGTDGAALMASIVITEARHCVALATIAGKSPVADLDLFLVTTAVATTSAPSA